MTRNLRGQIWSKLLVNSTFTGLSAVSGLRYGGVAEHPDGREAAYAIWAEGVAIGDAEGLRLESVYDVDPRARSSLPPVELRTQPRPLSWPQALQTALWSQGAPES
jgi:ketopantoate reductase